MSSSLNRARWAGTIYHHPYKSAPILCAPTCAVAVEFLDVKSCKINFRNFSVAPLSPHHFSVPTLIWPFFFWPISVQPEFLDHLLLLIFCFHSSLNGARFLPCLLSEIFLRACVCFAPLLLPEIACACLILPSLLR